MTTKKSRPSKDTDAGRVLEALETYRSSHTMNTDEIQQLTGLSKQQVESSINVLRKRYNFVIISQGRKPTTYTLTHLEPVVQSTQSKPAVQSTQSKPFWPSQNKLVSGDLACTMSERCMYLIKARRTVSSGYVEEFFDLSPEEARVLLNKVAHTYDSEIQLTITATVKTTNGL